jgi:hypothetical protein
VGPERGNEHPESVSNTAKGIPQPEVQRDDFTFPHRHDHALKRSSRWLPRRGGAVKLLNLHIGWLFDGQGE